MAVLGETSRDPAEDNSELLKVGAEALAFNECFTSGAGIHPWIATGRAWTGAPEARIGHTPFHLLTWSLSVFETAWFNDCLTGKRAWTHKEAKLRAKSLSNNAVMFRTGFSRPWRSFFGFWR